MNVKDQGSLTIHKYLNPDVKATYYGGAGFQGDGTVDKQPGGKPLPGVEFSVYGPLSAEDLKRLNYVVDDSDQRLDQIEVNQFIKEHKPVFQGITDSDGIVTWKNIPIDTQELNKNLYLVVETKAPDVDSQGHMVSQTVSAPVIVNIPSENPEKDSSNKAVDQYIYDVHLFMKNYSENEPGLGKTIDKPTNGTGEDIAYTLKVEPLSVHMDEYQELEVTDKLDPKVHFSYLGHAPKISSEDSVQFYNGSTKETKILVANVDYKVTTPDKGQTGTLIWTFTPEGIKKLTGIQENDGSYIAIYYTVGLTDDVLSNQVIPNDAKLDFVNQWGYGTKPKDGFPPVPPKPGNTVNTVLWDQWFEKSDKEDPSKKLEGAEFLVRNRSKKPVAAYNAKGTNDHEIVTYAPGTELYAILKGDQVIGWTPDWREAIRNEWFVVSGPDGQFHVGGLEYTWEPIFRKMYIFMVMGIADVNGTQMEYVDHYEYVLANKRTQSNISDNDIQKEIEKIISEHPPEKDGSGAWKFYKESEADPNRFHLSLNDMIDGLGEQINDYELIEIKPPNKYMPLEKNSLVSDKKETQDDLGAYNEDGFYVSKQITDNDFEHPLPFTVPGQKEDLLIDNSGIIHDIVPEEHPIVIPNAKLPVMPGTGVPFMFLLIIIGIILLLVAWYVSREDEKENTNISR